MILEDLQFKGYFQHIIFKSDDNYTVAVFVCDDRDETELTIVGYTGELLRDTPYIIRGNFTNHPRYGQQFNLSYYENQLPNDTENLIRYFSGSAFKGIGSKAATKIVMQLGSDAIALIREDHDIVNQINGLTAKQKAALLDGVDLDIDDSLVFFTQNGLTNRQINKIQSKYEDAAVELIKENPYRMVGEIDGIGFKTAERIAKNIGYPFDSDNRYKAAMLALVNDECMNSGDAFIDIELIQRKMYRHFNIGESEHFYDLLKQLLDGKMLYQVDDTLYSKNQYLSELGIADYFKLKLLDYEDDTNINYLTEQINSFENSIAINYDDKQKEAIFTFFKESFSILTGGPGTGKTTIVRAIIALYRDLYPNNQIALCAPTGRAAKRLTQLSDYSATTIHSLLKWDLESNTFAINRENPLSVDLLIVDEFSMVDSWLFYNLLSASENIKKILIIGDEDQLPSVGPGCVLRDLIASEIFPLSRLKKIYRQSEGSDVVELAHEIKQGRCDILDNGNEVKFFECQNYQARDQITKIVEAAYVKGHDLMSVQVLAPMYKGVAGINELNKKLQTFYNPARFDKPELRVGTTLFRLNDKVLQLKNQPDDNVFNGDIGIIKEISFDYENIDNENKIIVEFDDIIVQYQGDTLSNITLAYCISIHKSQGSEYPIVIMPILKDYAYMLERRLIYTGISRAKKSLVLLGSKEQLIKGINRRNLHERRTRLKERILANFE